MKITGHTQVYCVLGTPIAHSRSPLMHNTAFEALGMDCVYTAFDVAEHQMDAAVAGLRQLGVRGWNITMPDKHRMAQLCDQLSPAARLIGAVNTVCNQDGILTGHNTDGVGFMLAARDAGVDLRGKKLTILGVGGASTAIYVQAALDGASELSLFNRQSPSLEQARPLIRQLEKETGCHIGLYDLADEERLAQEISTSAALVNGTSMGMSPHPERCPLPRAELLPSGLLVYDVIYEPLTTRLLAMARQRGCIPVNGLGMLLWQGAEAFRLWTGQDMPIQAVKQAVFPELLT
ncbi:MAG: shikimate dehydrogenase [Eubacteriales bacterium]|jgi:quinate/shikimate dehydrogenase